MPKGKSEKPRLSFSEAIQRFDALVDTHGPEVPIAMIDFHLSSLNVTGKTSKLEYCRRRPSDRAAQAIRYKGL